MNEHKASRTLVKSPPELWAECSEASSLTRHLDQFGEIRITKLDPETTVAWEGERVSGTVRIEPSGWGTRVTLTAALEEEPAAVPEPEAVVPEPEAVVPEPEAEPIVSAAPHSDPPPIPVAPPRPRGLLARLLDFFGTRPAPPPGPPAPALFDPEPESAPESAVSEECSILPLPDRGDLEHPEPEEAPEPEVTPVVADLMDAEAALVAALDSLGQAHHRPFSRA